MVFASLVFLTLFLPANLICYYSLRRESHRHLLQVVFSLFFYAWGEPIWVSLLVLTSIWDYSAARLVERWLGTWKSKAALAASMSMNVGLLAVFKYSAFVVHNVNGAFGTHIGAPAFTLPIGIS